ncbi:hypothetical protein D3C87_1177070 [compost metagenome]
MKLIIAAIVLNFSTAHASAHSLEFCGQGGETLFNSQNVSECLQTTNTCQTQDLKNEGWLPSANGKCAPAVEGMQMCGFGGPEMMHPQNPSLRIQTLSTCDTYALQMMGWIVSK